MNIREDTTSLFAQDKEYVLAYIQSRNFKNKELEKIITTYKFGLLDELPIFVDGEEYIISHFLSKSDIAGYDIQKVNLMLQTDSTSDLVFALVLGDDVLVCDIKTGAVYLWRIQTGDGDRILIAESLTKFLKEIQL